MPPFQNQLDIVLLAFDPENVFQENFYLLAVDPVIHVGFFPRRFFFGHRLFPSLQLLKSQVHPHFLFNTINNIYALSKKGSPDTTEMIYRLSGLLEYMLYDSSREWISLEQEIRYIKNYLEIEKLRYGNRLDVSFTTWGNWQGVEVPPLILLPFVENAFKHGLSRQAGTCWLRIEVGYDEQRLALKVENSKPEAEAPPAAKGGIGISNVRKRLQILLGETFDIKQLAGADSYLVTLTFQPKITGHEKRGRQVAMPGSR